MRERVRGSNTTNWAGPYTILTFMGVTWPDRMSTLEASARAPFRPHGPRFRLCYSFMGTWTHRVLAAASVCLALLGCGRSSLSGARSDAQEDLSGAKGDSLEEFCSGGSPKAVINGVTSEAKVTGGIGMRSCCEAASFTVSTSSFGYKVIAGWQVWTDDEVFPAKIDLAHPGEGWFSWVQLTCSSGEVCYPAPDSYDVGFQGWLEVSRLGAGGFGSGFLMSICLRVAEAPESPHPLLHSFELFAPDITASPSL